MTLPGSCPYNRCHTLTKQSTVSSPRDCASSGNSPRQRRKNGIENPGAFHCFRPEVFNVFTCIRMGKSQGLHPFSEIEALLLHTYVRKKERHLKDWKTCQPGNETARINKVKFIKCNKVLTWRHGGIFSAILLL